MRKQIFLIFIFILIGFSSSFSQLLQWENDLDGHVSSLVWENTHTVLRDSLTGNHFSRTDSLNSYGLGIKKQIPQELTFRNLDITISLSTRTLFQNIPFSLVFSIVNNDSTIYWISYPISSNSNWKSTTIKITIPRNLILPENSFSIYGWNSSGKNYVDIDNLKIEFKELVQQTFLPEIKIPENKGQGQVLLAGNNSFNFLGDTINGDYTIVSSNGDTILESASVFIKYKKSQKDKIISSLLLACPKTIHTNFTTDSKKIVCEYSSKIISVNLEYFFNGNRLEIKSHIKFLKDCAVLQASVIYKYRVELRKVFTKNSMIDSLNFNSEYWLDKEGVQFKGSLSDFLIYRNQKISSFQLSKDKKLVIFNCEYSYDHPFMYFPELDKSRSFFTDRSCQIYKKGDVLDNDFLLSEISKNKNIVRVLKNPDGYLGSMVWTEHADFSDIRTQRAVNFGSEDIINADSSTGGFVGQKIPITKSVFYSNPEDQKNSVKDKRFSTSALSITGSDSFKEFLFQLKLKKYDVCLHTPDPFTTTLKIAQDALSFMKNNFGSPTWIDHGYDNDPKSNREDVVCDGVVRNSKHDLSEQFLNNGVHYFWNNYYEDSAIFKNAAFNSFFSSPYLGWGNCFPTPEYFKLPNIDFPFYSWLTTFTLDPPNGDLWSFYFSENRLNDLYKSATNCILHCYPARVDSTTGFYTYSGDKIIVNSEFDNALHLLRSYYDSGKILVTTISELMNYRMDLEKIKISTGLDGRCLIFNEGENSINGVSFITEAKDVSAGEKNIVVKRNGLQTIFIMSLNPKEKVVVDLQ